MIFMVATIILYNHVMHDDTSIHNIPKALFGPKILPVLSQKQIGLAKSQMLSPHLS
jgi:hypothetical protein